MAKPREETIRVQGYREFLSACSKMPPEIRKDVREVLKQVGEKVRADSEQKTGSRLRSPHSAEGYRVVVRTRGVDVEQSLRKTTGNRPDWGASQMRYSLVPALQQNESETEQRMDAAMREVVDFFELAARWRASGLISRKEIAFV